MVANQERGEFRLVIGDQVYLARLTTNACAEIEDVFNGRTWDQVVAGMYRGSLKDVRVLLWAALRENHPDIATDDPASVKTIGKLIDEAGGLVGLTLQLQHLMAVNTAPKEDEEAPAKPGERPPDPPDVQAPTGDHSTAMRLALA